MKFVTGANFGTKEDNLLFKVRSLLLKSCLSQKGGVTYDALIGALKRLQAYALRQITETKEVKTGYSCNLQGEAEVARDVRGRQDVLYVHLARLCNRNR